MNRYEAMQILRQCPEWVREKECGSVRQYIMEYIDASNEARLLPGENPESVAEQMIRELDDRETAIFFVEECPLDVDDMEAYLIYKQPIPVRNPWTREIADIELGAVTDRKLDAMAQIMDDEIRERVHMEIAPCTPGEFFARYAEIVGPDAAGVLWFS